MAPRREPGPLRRRSSRGRWRHSPRRGRAPAPDPSRRPGEPRSPKAPRPRARQARGRSGRRSAGQEFAWDSPGSSDFVRQRVLLTLTKDVHRHLLFILQVLEDGGYLFGGGEVHPVHLLENVTTLEPEPIEGGAGANRGESVPGRLVPLE